MSVLGSISRQDKGTARSCPTWRPRPESTGFFQNIGAGFTQAKAGPHSTQNAKAIYESRHYDQIIQALERRGREGDRYGRKPGQVDSPFYHPSTGEAGAARRNVLIPVKRSSPTRSARGQASRAT
jgi:hypothetical protein